MEWSNYNFLFKLTDDIWLLYNSLSNTFIELDEDQYNEITNIKNNPFRKIDSEFYDELFNYKIIVKSNTSEYNKLKLEAFYKRMDSQVMSLTIAPTLDCNFRCTYCYEDNVIEKKHISDELINSILEFIKSNKDIKKLHITWYGGEPLLVFDKIEYLTNCILKQNIEYESMMVTNGYLLNDDIVNKMIRLHIKKLQITIDGKEDTHDKRRFLENGERTYKKIVGNVKHIIDNYDDINIVVRVNIDKENENDFIHVYKLFEHYLDKDNFTIYPGFTEDINSCINSSDCFFDQNAIGNFMLNFYNQHKIDLGLFPDNDRSECMARNINSYLIGPDGNMYKCWNDIGRNERSIANLLDDNFLFNMDLLSDYLVGEDQLDDVTCKNCFFLPICIGGCPNKKIFLKGIVKRNSLCHIAKGKLESFLKLYYEHKNSIGII